MTMMSFRVDDAEAEDAQRWARQLGIDRSELLREALHRHLVRLATEHDMAAYDEAPISESEMALASSAGWGPAEDWSDWSDAAG